MQLYPQSSDLYSDITAVTKAGKVRSSPSVCVCVHLSRVSAALHLSLRENDLDIFTPFLDIRVAKTGQNIPLALVFSVRLLPRPVQLLTAWGPVQSIVGAAQDFGQGGGQEERWKGAEEERGGRRWGLGTRGLAPSQVAEDFERVRGEAEGAESRPSPGHQQVCCERMVYFILLISVDEGFLIKLKSESYIFPVKVSFLASQ